MTILERIHAGFGGFTRSERKVAHALLADYPVAGLETVARLAARAHTSGPTIMRFVSHLGFERYSDFQQALRRELQDRLQSPLARYDDGIVLNRGDALIDRIARAVVANVRGALGKLPRASFQAIVALLADGGRPLHFLGGSYSQQLAAHLYRYLRPLRSRTQLIGSSGPALAEALLDLGADDVLVTFDFRRYQNDVIAFAHQARRQGATLVLFTDPWQSPIAAWAQHVVCCPVQTPTAYDSAVAGLAMVEALVAGVVELQGAAAKARIATLEGLRAPFEPRDPDASSTTTATTPESNS